MVKETMKTERVPMPEQAADLRGKNFDEVPHGYSEDDAVAEALRCIQCKKPRCVSGCPVQVRIPEFIKLICERKFIDAARTVKETNYLPAVCGRVCPQETQCEGNCVVGKKGDPVGIGNLERFVADYERRQGQVQPIRSAKKLNRKVAVIGSGPAGLTAAGELIRAGFKVTVYEALHKPGGVLVYGIPEFRLPKSIVSAEVDFLIDSGVEVKYDHVIGSLFPVEELLNGMGYDAIFVGSGAGLPSFLGIPGENHIGVYSANEYLTRANLMKSYLFPSFDTPILLRKRIVTVGGGNVAMDCARTALRLGAEESIIVYRRSLEELPARVAEVHHAQEEGIVFDLLTNPVAVLGDENGLVTGLRCIRMELGEPDESGRRRPVAKPGSEFDLTCDLVIIAIGNKPNPLIPSSLPDMNVSKWGTIEADEQGRTSVPKVYAGGDIVTGAATVIEAMGAGRTAAQAIIADLAGS
ncbi:MAG: NADPH-dependent glutamate synthase [Deltaproteobacteria bacterium]|nr:NADPH-dependent glutamate synthase [Deltaproteobacteria bacterium]